MDTVMDLRVQGSEELLRAAEQEIYGLEKLLSVTDEGSEVYALNRAGEGALSEPAAALLRSGLALCERTGGALDLTVYPLVRAWGFTTGEYRVPSEEERAALLEKVDYTGVSVDGAGRVTLPPGTELDLGSVAKGWAADRVTALWREAGVTSALLNLGGNVHALGTKPDGTAWRVAVADPFGGSGCLGVLEVTDKAVVTSGGYERYFERDGETYWHILDPATGAPAKSGLVSVTVVGEKGVTCDGLSTALFVLGAEKAAALWRESDDFEAVFVTEAGEILVTAGLAGCFRPLDDYADAEVTVIGR
jgi:thiamine biosynthesis lipoprotein